MSVLTEVATTVVTPEAGLSQATANRKRTATFQCLVVSPSTSRREMLSQAANEAGWDTVTCAGADRGWTAIQRERFQLALIDMQEPTADESEYRDLAEQISENSKTLLVLCGKEGDASQEIWARQTGAWLYLPGVSQNSDVTALCDQAMPVAEKLNGCQREDVLV